MNSIEWVSWAPLLGAIVVLGLFPSIIFAVTTTAVNGVLRLVGV